MLVKSFITEGLDKSKPIIMDTETLGLYGRTRLIQVRQGDVAYEYDCFYINIEDIKYWLKDCHLVFHNAIYDLSCPDFKRWLPRKFDDTLILSRQSWPYLESFSLGSLATHWNLSVKGEEGNSDWSAYNLTDAQLAYASNDTLITEQLFNLIPEETFKEPSYILDIESIRLACVYQWKGMVISKNNIKELKKECKKVIKSFNLPEDLNVNSSKQVTEFLGIEGSASQEALLTLAEEMPIAWDIRNKRVNLKRLSYLETMENKDFIFSRINPIGAHSGRFTSSGDSEETFNLQQIPRELKRAFGFDKKEGFYVCADYPMLEVWVCGAIVPDDKLTDILRHRKDLHRETASGIFGIPPEEIITEQRYLGKTCNFSLMFGAGAKSLKEILEYDSRHVGKKKIIPLETAEELKSKWHNLFKGITLNQKRTFDYFRGNDYKIIQTPMGRKARVDSPLKALNYPVQGGGAECTKMALWLLNRMGIIPANTVHDSICLIASTEKEAQEYKEALAWSMEEAYRRVIKNCPVNDLSLKVEVDVDYVYH